MIGSFLTRGLALIFGYAYPAYECFKTVEMNKPDIEQLRFWCQYWILVAVLTVFERVCDAFISWIPMYGEAKLAFFIYLWYPKTKGTTYVYDSFFRPVVSEHENEIDRNLLELRTRAGDMVVLYWQKAISYGQTRIFDVLQYIASQSSAPTPAQTQQQGAKVRQPTAPPNPKRVATKTVAQVEEPPSPASSGTSSSQQQDDETEDTGPSEAPVVASTSVVSSAQKTTPAQHVSETTRVSASSEEVMEIDTVIPSTNENIQPKIADTVIEEGNRRITRARSRKAHSSTT